MQKKIHSVFCLLFFFFLLAPGLYAQDTLSVRERFWVDVTEGCAPLTVEIKGEDFSQLPNFDPNADYVRWYGYRSTNPDIEPLEPAVENGKTLLLPEPGEYYILQLLQNEGMDSLLVQVHAPLSPDFKIFNCGNNSISVNVNPSNKNYDYYQVSLESQEDQIAQPNNNYTIFFENVPTGSTTVRVKGMYDGLAVDQNCTESSKDIQVISTLEPANILGLNARIKENTILLNYQLQQDALQILEVANEAGFYEEYDTLQGNELLIGDLAPQSNFYCFRIKTISLCQGEEIFSNTLCSAELTGSSSAAGNEIHFKTASVDQTQSILLRDGQEAEQFGTAQEATYLDTEVMCENTYSYSIRTVYPDGRESLTEGLDITTQYSATLAAPENITSFWQDQAPHFQVQLMNEPKEGEFMAFRGSYTSPAATSENSLLKLNDQGTSSCYRFAYKDACGNESGESQEVCALYLSNNTTQPDVLKLQWNEYTGYRNGVRTYVLSKYNPDGSFEASYPMGLSTSADLGVQPIEDNGSIYIVTAFPWDDTEESSSNAFVFNIEVDAYFPNAFTPDGDRLNDEFKAEGKFVTGCTLEIYNRWGEQIFRTNELESGWDGTAKGKPAPTGTYLYKALIETEDGDQQSRSGTVFLIR